jgi:hypothetical protein
MESILYKFIACQICPMGNASTVCRLTSLPLELRRLIASYVDDEDLIRLRNCHNRAITDGVDDEFVCYLLA